MTPHQQMLNDFQRQAFSLMTRLMTESMAALVEQGYGEWEIKKIISEQRNIAGQTQKKLKECRSVGECLSVMRNAIKAGLDVNADIIRFDQWWMFTSTTIMDNMIGYKKVNAHEVASQIKKEVRQRMEAVR